MILIPTDEQFVESVAKAIGKDRLYRDATNFLMSTLGIAIKDSDTLERRIDIEFEKLWASNDAESVWNKENFKADALIAINKINLALLTMEC